MHYLLGYFTLAFITSGGSDITFYPLDSLPYGDLTGLFPLGGASPSPRVCHTITIVGNLLIVYGGYSYDQTFLGDIYTYDMRSQSWSGIIRRLECCNSDDDIIDVAGLDHPLNLPESRAGFQGDIPLARAEHSSVSLFGLLYIFGGVSRFGLLNDMYQFDPIALVWSPVIALQRSLPSKRAGHSMVNYLDKIYLFGGRGLFPINGLNGTTHGTCGLNDVWRYDPTDNSWTLLQPPTGSVSPIGRQYTAAAASFGRLWLFGGLDPSSNTVFNDIWAFSVYSYVWTCVQPVSGTVTGFAPPPLYFAHLIPLPYSHPSSSPPSKISFLLYGGIGSGGTCGFNLNENIGLRCNPLQTVLGQVYRLELSFGIWTSPRLHSPTANPDGYFVSSSSWHYARLTSSDGGLEQKVLRKLYAFESVVFSEERQLLYEFGGLSVSHSSADNGLRTDNQIARGLYSPLSLSAGGNLGSPLWDVSTGEQVRQTVDIPANGKWTFSDGFTTPQPLSNESSVVFLDNFRVYLVSAQDMVLI